MSDGTKPTRLGAENPSAQQQCWSPAHIGQHFIISKVLTLHPSIQRILTKHSSVPGMVLGPEPRQGGNKMDKKSLPMWNGQPSGGDGQQATYIINHWQPHGDAGTAARCTRLSSRGRSGLGIYNGESSTDGYSSEPQPGRGH